MKRYFVLSLGLIPLVLLFLLFYGVDPATTFVALPPTAVQLEGPVTATMGTSATFTATVSPPTVTTPVTMTWSASGQAPSVHTVSTTIDTKTYTWATPGTYTVVVMAENDEGMVATSGNIDVLDIPINGVILAHDSPVMIGEDMHFSAGVLQGTNVTYAWDFGDGITDTGEMVTHTYASGGDFEVELTATNTAGSVEKTADVEVLLPSLQFASVSNGVAEDGGTVTLTVELSEPVAVDVQVDYATADAAAIAIEDYIAATGTLTFTAGDTEEQFSLTVVDDLLDEMDESFKVSLSNPVNADVGAISNANVLIGDNDNPPTVSIADAEITEGDSGTDDMDFTVYLDAPSGRYITVNYITNNSSAVAPDDYEAITTGVLNFNRGVTTMTVTVPIVGEMLVESTEHFIVEITSVVNVVMSDTVAYGTIYDTDVYPTLSFASETFTDTEICEATGVEVQLSHAYPEAVWVMLNMTDGTAIGGQDYVNDAVKVQFEPGETSTYGYVHISRDTLREDPESITLSLTDPHTATIATPDTATLWIEDSTFQLFMPLTLRLP